MISESISELGLVAIFAVLISAFARNRGWNPSLLLLSGGLVIGSIPIGPNAPADPELVLVLVLAPLVFGEALSSSIVDLRRVSRPVMALAIWLVVFGAFIVGLAATAIIPGIPLAAALCLGAILGPTDAVAVSATAKAAGLPRRLVNILEGESLVNDGTALTLLRVCAAAMVVGTVSAGEVTVILFESVAGGVLIGAIGGFILIQIVKRSRDTTVANGCVLIAPLPIYSVAENIEGSGILAVVIAALILAHATSSAVGYAGRLQSTSVWRTIIFVLQAVAFFLVGLEVPDALSALSETERLALFRIVPVILLALIAARFLFVFAMTTVNGTRKLYPRSWIVTAWAGTRGPISALAAFTLPLFVEGGGRFPERSLIISVTFCVVVLSLLLAPTVAPLARRLKLPQDDDTELLRRVRISLARASLDRLQEIAQAADRNEEPIDPQVVDHLRATAERRLVRVSKGPGEGETGVMTNAKVVQELSTEMSHAEQEELLRLRDEEGLPDVVMRSLQKELDVRVRALGTPR